MPKNNASAESNLQKLGQRLRHIIANSHPPKEVDIQAALGAVREEWAKEQEVQRQKKPALDLIKPQEREPEEPDDNR